MSSAVIAGIVALYFLFLLLIARITSKGADNNSFFVGNKNSPWYLVAFGMIGTSLSGVTFISVPGWVGTSQFSYLQMVLGYLLGYVVVANILMPLYYRLNLTSIYTYLEQRFGFWSYKTGAFYFLLSRTIGAAFRLYLVANVLQIAIFDDWNIPYYLTVAITILLIWVYTAKGGIKTIVWTDALQTLFMLLAVGVAIYQIGDQLNLGFSDLISTVKASDYSKVFFFDDWRASNFFWKQFLSGAFITIVMTGLDQDMMQKNLSCKNIKEAKWNMFSMSIVLVLVNLLFLVLGALLFIYSNQNGIEITAMTDELFPSLALSNTLGIAVSVFFILGLIAAAYSSADSALTALTTSVCVDFLAVEKKPELEAKKTRKATHIIMSFVLYLVILLFSLISDESVISSLFKVAGYTYGPLLGLYVFGLLHKINLKDKWVPLVCLVCPVICYVIQLNSESWLNGYKFGFELLMLNGLLTYFGLHLLRKKRLKISV
ncbi:sodium:solute symporter [Vicingaceae bacterium]|nr:sodium:solute symporter [Vicingaceae bacterium]MDB4060656.1 sodium:solute symporter [Vicingaceae bacterium]